MVYSPLTGKENVSLVKEIDVNFLKKRYLKNNVNVEKYFGNIRKIQLMECNDTAYRFYYPFNIAGDGDFYRNLQKNINYSYRPGRWEHIEAAKYIEEHSNLLEIGCARGEFIEKLSESKDITCTGIELNPECVEACLKKGLDVKLETVEEHAGSNHENYDYVILFQVIEHIADVKAVLEKTISCMKTGGLLIVSVPNNASFIKYNNTNILNMPPHHMGLWGTKSLKSLEQLFEIKLVDLVYETLQEYHIHFFLNSLLQYYDERYQFWGKLYRTILLKILNKILYKPLNRLSDTINGHTILAVYQKY